MISCAKELVKEHKITVTALLLGILAIVGVIIGNVISSGAAIVWAILFIICGGVLVCPTGERFIYPCMLIMMAYTAECFMQLQIEHSFALSVSYQRVIDFGLYCLFFIVFSTITKRKSIGLIIGNLFFFAVATLNLVVTVFRGKPVYFPDIYSAKTAMTFADEYTFPVSKVHLICGMFVAACMLYCVAFRRKEADNNGTTLVRLRNTICVVLIPVLIVTLRIPAALHLRGYYFTTTEYWLYSFSLSAYQMYVEKPKNYDPNVVPIEEVSDLQKNSEQQMPNVLFIMNESFADLRVISSFKGDDTVMPYFDALSEESSSGRGNLYVSIYGGNTANTEFEVLTGVSMYYLPYDTTAYNLYVNSETISLASYFNDLGYRTVAFHPSAQTNYNRENVYPNLGFSESYFQEDFDDLETLRTFTRDDANYEKVIEMFEEKNADEQLFLFNLTVQNHGPFNIHDNLFENKVILEDKSFALTQQYLSCVRYSDAALELLIDYLEDYPEPVAVVFFGDHQAKIDDSFYEMLYEKSLDDLNDSEMKSRYIVPYLIWTNYGIEFQDDVNMSANYLGAYVIERLGLPQTGFHKFLNTMRQTYPVITAQGIGAELDVTNDNLQLQAYENCCYNLLFDKENLWYWLYQNSKMEPMG